MVEDTINSYVEARGQIDLIKMKKHHIVDSLSFYVYSFPLPISLGYKCFPLFSP